MSSYPFGGGAPVIAVIISMDVTLIVLIILTIKVIIIMITIMIMVSDINYEYVNTINRDADNDSKIYSNHYCDYSTPEMMMLTFPSIISKIVKKSERIQEMAEGHADICQICGEKSSAIDKGKGRIHLSSIFKPNKWISS